MSAALLLRPSRGAGYCNQFVCVSVSDLWFTLY